MTRHFCTYFDHNYLPRGLVMLESLHEHYPEAQVHVLCLSDECHDALSSLTYPFVSLIRLDELEAADPELAATRPTRSQIEYYFTITPCLPWHLLTKRGLDEVTYLDADMMFFSSPAPIFKEAGEASVILTPHRFPPRLDELREWGLYNVSWLTFRNTPSGLECLSWYRDACLEWCRDRLEETRFADQKYLDAFTARFEEVHVMEHPGGGVAPWNLEGCSVQEQDGAVTVNGAALIFYHAHGFRHIRGPFYASGFAEYTSRPQAAVKKHILGAYARKYKGALRKARGLIAGQAFTGIRFQRRPPRALLRDGKRLIKEWRQGTLLICL